VLLECGGNVLYWGQFSAWDVKLLGQASLLFGSVVFFDPMFGLGLRSWFWLGFFVFGRMCCFWIICVCVGWNVLY